jgi:hypothetical protein
LRVVETARQARAVRGASDKEKGRLWPLLLTAIYPTFDRYRRKTKRGTSSDSKTRMN